MAPEQLAGREVDGRADLWALGATFQFLVTGKPPFEAETLPELSAAVLRDLPRELPSSLDPRLAQVLSACLEKDPERRMASAAELAGALARELQELKVDLTTDTNELQETEGAYQNNLRQAKLTQKEFEERVRKLETQLSQVKIKEAQAEAAAALSSVAFNVGDLGDSMKTVEEVLAKRYERSAGKARVAADMVNMDQIHEKEAERKALEQAALAEFLASQGIQSPSTAESPAAAKEIGPSQKS